MRKSIGVGGPTASSRIFDRRSDDRGRQLPRAARRLAAPERNRRRRALRVFHAHAAGLDAADAPRRRAEQEHVAGHALDGEILVERADDRFVGLGEHEELRVVGNRAAGRDRRQARAAPAAHDAVHAIAMEKRAAAAALGADALGQHVDDGVEIAARQIGVAIRAANEREQIVLLPVLGGGHRDDLLRQHVERRRRARAADRARPAQSTGPARRIRSARRAWSRRSAPSAWSCARPDGPSGRCAAARRRSIAASRSGRRDRRCRCRCRARATPWRRPPSACRSSAALRPSAAACATGCRDARAPRLRRAARRDDAPRARPAAAC